MSEGLSEPRWFKSSHSGGRTDCVEVAWLADGRVGVRDSKNVSAGALVFAPSEWDAFTAFVRDGKLHRPA